MHKTINFIANNNIKLIPIHQIEIDYIMENTLKEQNANINLSLYILKTRNSIVGKILTRIDYMLDGINKKVNFEPVVLQQLDFETYSIIDGRHRIVGSILNGYKYIPAIISN